MNIMVEWSRMDLIRLMRSLLPGRTPDDKPLFPLRTIKVIVDCLWPHLELYPALHTMPIMQELAQDLVHLWQDSGRDLVILVEMGHNLDVEMHSVIRRALQELPLHGEWHKILEIKTRSWTHEIPSE